MYQRHKAPQSMSSLLRMGNKSQSLNAVLALQMGNSNHSHSLQLLQEAMIGLQEACHFSIFLSLQLFLLQLTKAPSRSYHLLSTSYVPGPMITALEVVTFQSPQLLCEENIHYPLFPFFRVETNWNVYIIF